jgi:hypothetical protein
MEPDSSLSAGTCARKSHLSLSRWSRFLQWLSLRTPLPWLQRYRPKNQMHCLSEQLGEDRDIIFVLVNGTWARWAEWIHDENSAFVVGIRDRWPKALMCHFQWDGTNSMKSRSAASYDLAQCLSHFAIGARSRPPTLVLNADKKFSAVSGDKNSFVSILNSDDSITAGLNRLPYLPGASTEQNDKSNQNRCRLQIQRIISPFPFVRSP